MLAVRRFLLPLLVAATTLGACGSEPAVDAFGEARALEGVWVLTEAATDGVGLGDETLLVLELALDDAILTAQGPCHRLLGSFTVTDAGLATFTVPGTGTSSCDAGELETELALVDALESVDSWTLDGDQLILTGDDVTLTFTDS